MSNIETGGPAFPTNRVNMRGEVVPDEDGMTLRQYAAIKLKVPNSGAEWLDDMIRESLRDEFAAKAMQGLMDRAWGDIPADELFAIWSESAYAISDGMAKARGS